MTQILFIQLKNIDPKRKGKIKKKKIKIEC